MKIQFSLFFLLSTSLTAWAQPTSTSSEDLSEPKTDINEDFIDPETLKGFWLRDNEQSWEIPPEDQDASPDLAELSTPRFRGSNNIERRGQDRRQQDQSKPIDFSLLTPCYEQCFWKFNHVAPQPIDKVSIGDWCRDPAARWRWWSKLSRVICTVLSCVKTLLTPHV